MAEEEARAFVKDGWGTQAHDSCARMVEALRQENGRQNLISRGSLNDVWVRHVADSAQLLLHAPAICRSWIDIGTGAGFPGLVVAILRPDLAVKLVEPRHKRIEWLANASATLGLRNCRLEHGYAGATRLEPFDVVSARAVASLAELLAMTRLLAHHDTYGIFPKGRSAQAELHALTPDVLRQYVFHVKHSLTAEDARIIVCQRAKD